MKEKLKKAIETGTLAEIDEAIKNYLKAGMDINAPIDENGNQALYFAVQRKDIAIIKMLVKNNATPHSGSGRILDVAKELGLVECLEVFQANFGNANPVRSKIYGAKIAAAKKIAESQQINPIVEQFQNKFLNFELEEIEKILQENPNIDLTKRFGPYNDRPLIYAVHAEDIDVINLLIKYGDNPHFNDNEALHLAAKKNLVHILLSFKKKFSNKDNNGLYQSLIAKAYEKGPHYKDYEQNVLAQNYNAIKQHLENGVDPNMLVGLLKKPALSYVIDHKDIMKLLIEHKADMTIMNYEILNRLKNAGDVETLIYAAECDPSNAKLYKIYINFAYQKNPETMEKFADAFFNLDFEAVRSYLEHGLDADAVIGQDKVTPLYYLIHYSDGIDLAEVIKFVNLLLAYGADPGKHNFRILQEASEKGYVEILVSFRGKARREHNTVLETYIKSAQLIKNIFYKEAIVNNQQEIIKEFLNSSVEINTVLDESGNSALYFAVLAKNDDLVEKLLEKNANFELMNKSNETPVKLAVANGYVYYVELFKQKVTGKLRLDAYGRYLVEARKNAEKNGLVVSSQEKPNSYHMINQTTSKPSVSEFKNIKLINSNAVRIFEVLGKGGFGTVFRATWESTPVAVKRINMQREDNNSKLLKEFYNEVKALESCRHPNIINILGIIDEQFSIVLEYAEKGSLYSYIKNIYSNKQNDFSLQQRHTIVQNIASGLYFLHNNGVIHADIKSGNILLTNDIKAKITDFGLSKVKDSSLTSTRNVVKGTINYMAPELFDYGAKPTRESDIYAFGCVVWEVFSLKVPYEGVDDKVLVAQIRTSQPPINPEWPKKYQNIMHGSFFKNSKERLQLKDTIVALETTEDTTVVTESNPEAPFSGFLSNVY